MKLKNMNSFLTRLRKLFKGGKYSREETIRGNTVYVDVPILMDPLDCYIHTVLNFHALLLHVDLRSVCRPN